MAKIKTGSSLPSDCTAVDNLPIRLLSADSGTVQPATGAGVTARGKLLLSSRKDDVIAAFSAEGITVCDDAEHPFATAGAPLSMYVKQGLMPIWLCGWDSFGTNTEPFQPAVHVAVMNACLAAVRNNQTKFVRIANTVFGLQFSLGSPGLEAFDDWTIVTLSNNAAVTSYFAGTHPSATLATTGILDMLQEPILPTADERNIMTTLVNNASAIRSYLATGGGLLAQGTYDLTVDPSGPPPGRPYVWGWKWVPLVFPGITVYHHEGQYNRQLTAAGAAALPGITNDILNQTDLGPTGGFLAHFAGAVDEGFTLIADHGPVDATFGTYTANPHHNIVAGPFPG